MQMSKKNSAKVKRLLKLTGIDFRHPDKGECKAALILGLDQTGTGKKSLQNLMRYELSHFEYVTCHVCVF